MMLSATETAAMRLCLLKEAKANGRNKAVVDMSKVKAITTPVKREKEREKLEIRG